MITIQNSNPENMEFKVNNQEAKMKSSVLIEKMEERASRRFDVTMGLSEAYESLINGDIQDFSENAKSQFFNKLNINQLILPKLSSDTKRAMIRELAADYDDRNKAKGLVRFERNLKGQKIARAVLSSDYAVIDSVPVFKALVPVIGGDNLIVRDYVDDDFYTRGSFIIGAPISLGTIDGKPDVYFVIATITNSETGNGAFSITAGLWRMWCKNGAISIKQEFGTHKIIHKFRNPNEVIDNLRTIDANKLIESTTSMVDMYQKSKGIILLPNQVEEAYTNFQSFLPKTMIDKAKILKGSRYNQDSSMFNVYNSITETIHLDTKNLHTRFEREAKAYDMASTIVDAYVKM